MSASDYRDEPLNQLEQLDRTDSDPIATHSATLQGVNVLRQEVRR
jgi:hypothetical protein